MEKMNKKEILSLNADINLFLGCLFGVLVAFSGTLTANFFWYDILPTFHPILQDVIKIVMLVIFCILMILIIQLIKKASKYKNLLIKYNK